MRVLLIAQEDVVLEIMRLALEHYGHEVVVSRGLDAHELVHKAEYGAVITELRLGSLKGSDVVRVLRAALDARPQPRWIGITASLPSSLSDEALAAGFDSVLLKPVTLVQLNAAVLGHRIPWGYAPHAR